MALRRPSSSMWQVVGYSALAMLAVARTQKRERKEGELTLVPPASVREGEQSTGWWSIVKDAAAGWIAHKAARLGAALAYYSVFSLGPLLVIIIAMAGLVFGQEAVQGTLSAQLQGVLGVQAANGLQALLATVAQPRGGVLTTIFGIITLLFAALGIIIQLKDALNSVWGAEAPKRAGMWGFVRTYAVGLLGVLVLGFLLLLSLFITAALSAMVGVVVPYVPEFVFQVLSFLISTVVISLVFAITFKYLPDRESTWGNVLPGAVVTALLFQIGSQLTGLYIGKQGVGSTFGAAASVVVVLIWVYYSAQMVLFGAELTRAYESRKQRS
jgi:membrane protein